MFHQLKEVFLFIKKLMIILQFSIPQSSSIQWQSIKIHYLHNALFDGLKNASNEIIIILDRFLFSVFFTKEIT